MQFTGDLWDEYFRVAARDARLDWVRTSIRVHPDHTLSAAMERLVRRMFEAGYEYAAAAIAADTERESNGNHGA